MAEAQTVRALLDRGDPGAPAIGAPGRTYLDYAGLGEHIDRTVASLNLGYHRKEYDFYHEDRRAKTLIV